MSAAVTLNLDEMRALKAELDKANGARVRVGILGDKAGRWGPGSGDLNNPSLGATHEFGSIQKNIPARSFLRVPLMTRLPAEVDRIGRVVWRTMILERSVLTTLRALGVLAENIVQRAFETGGFGQWAPLSPRYARWKETLIRTKARKLFSVGPIRMTLLVLSGQLRRAITSRVTMYGAQGRVTKGGATGTL